jgi:prepilin-type processing-associated H-X9-DG protein
MIKKIFIRSGIVLAMFFLAPIIWSAFGTHGYFESGRCLCGFYSFTYFENGALWKCCPGHGTVSPSCSLVPDGVGWKLHAIVPPSEPNPNYVSVVIITNGEFMGRLKIENRDLYSSNRNGSNWTRVPRVWNVWSVWWQRAFVHPDRPRQTITCVKNLKLIGLELIIWAGDHQNKFPFQVSTNAGGTLEFCATAKDGFDTNTFLHFKAMMGDDYLGTPRLLACPQDSSRIPATNWADFCAANVSYRLRSSAAVNDAHPREILAVCPVDGNVLYCDGSVVEHK